MTIEELIIHSAEEIRRSPGLFAEYIRLYTLEKGKKPPCAGCSLASTLSKWLRDHEPKLESMSDNTFKLVKGKTFLRVPFTGQVITKDSPDELVEFFLAQAKGDELEKRKAAFEILPSAKKDIEDSDVEAPKKRSRKKKSEA